jgi:nucleoside-diphosphate-sugar epimerase
VLTGASGFLGRHVLGALQDHEVLCLSRDPRRIAAARNVRTIRADFGESGDWIDEVARFDPEWCFHLAWEGLPDYSPERCRTNLAAGRRLVDAVARAGMTRLIVAGTCWEYGAAAGPVAEDRAPVDVGVFAATKLELLESVREAAGQHGFGYRWARLFFVYGPGQRPTSLIPSLRTAYLAGNAPDIREPGAVQDFIHVTDAAEGLVALAAADTASGVFNVGTGRPTSVAAVANQVADGYGQPRPFESAGDGRGFWAETTRTLAAAGWRARIGIEAGIAQTLAVLDAGA